MSSYAASAALGAQPRNDTDHTTIFNWIKRRLVAQQQRMAKKRFITQLRSLDRHLLQDLGIDPDILASDATVALCQQNPHVVAACMVADSLNRSRR